MSLNYYINHPPFVANKRSILQFPVNAHIFIKDVVQNIRIEKSIIIVFIFCSSVKSIELQIWF